jgi:hypothetical protein
MLMYHYSSAIWYLKKKKIHYIIKKCQVSYVETYYIIKMKWKKELNNEIKSQN